MIVKIKLLISTIKGVYYYDKDIRKLNISDNCYGITWNKSNVYISGENQSGYCIYQLDKNFEIVKIINLDINEPHQIFWKDDLYICNTGRNRIDILGGKQISWNPADCDRDHINSIWYKNKKWYIIEMRRRTKDDPFPMIRICNNLFETKELIPIDCDGLHNIYEENNILYSLASSEIIMINRLTKKEKRRNIYNQKTLTRGLARTKDYWIIGVSTWQPIQANRPKGDGHILILDNNFNLIDEIYMPDASQITEVRVISEKDYAHNKNIW